MRRFVLILAFLIGPFDSGVTFGQPLGACCSQMGVCSTNTQVQCNAIGGRWASSASACADVAHCDGRVCCLPDGMCRVLYDTTLTCAGTVRPDRGTCQGVFCSVTQSERACCPPDQTCRLLDPGSCRSSSVGGLVVTQLVCTNVVCPPFGSCCASNGQCTRTDDANCSGSWTQGGVCNPNSCPQPPAPGACCNGLCCTVIQRSDCGATWLGSNTSCTACSGNVSSIWLTFGYSGTQCGTASQPLGDLQSAVDAVTVNGDIYAAPGSSGLLSITVSKPMTISAPNGAVTIGR